MNIPNTEQKRVVVIGGGFAGISFAKNLKGIDVQMVLLDQHNYHTFQPLLYQVSTSGLEPDSIAYPIRKILRSLDSFYFRLATVQHIDPKKSIIEAVLNAPLQSSLQVLNQDMEDVKSKFAAKGIVISENDTIAEIAKKQKTSPFDMINVIMQK